MLALLFAIALASEASHTSSIDIFEADTSPNKPDWSVARSGHWSKEHIPWTIDAQQGDGTVKFGDVRFRDEILIGDPFKDNGDAISYKQDPHIVMMAVRINGVDDYVWPYWEEDPGLWLASKPKDSNYISSDPSSRVWQDEHGFFIFDHNITDLTVTGLPWFSQTTVNIIFFAVAGAHDSMAAHGVTHCLAMDLTKSPDQVPCVGTALWLTPIGWMMIQPFPHAPEVAPTAP